MEKIGISGWARDNYFLLTSKMADASRKIAFTSEIDQSRQTIEKILKEIEQMQ